jgi:hypothetical protein
VAEPQQREAALSRELETVLIAHLPIGMEGVGSAQASSVQDVLHRHGQRPQVRDEVGEPQRQGLRMLRDLAMTHKDSAVIALDGQEVCLMCVDNERADGAVVWPCPVWVVAQHMGVAVEPTSDNAPRRGSLLNWLPRRDRRGAAEPEASDLPDLPRIADGQPVI